MVFSVVVAATAISPAARIATLRPTTVNLITQQVREYAASHNITDVEALKAGMREKSDEFRRAGEIYVKK